MIRKSALCVAAVVLLFVAIGVAQAKDKNSAGGKSQQVTGCVMKGEEAGGFTLKSDDGTVYELQSKKVNVGEHVGHKVTVTGSETHGSKAHEEKKASAESKEAGSAKPMDFRVTDLKMVSDSCQ